MWQASLLRVADTADSNRLSRERCRGEASSGDARETDAELIDGLRGEDVRVRNRQIPVIEIMNRRKSGDRGPRERHILGRVREEKFRRYLIGLRQA